MPRAAIPDRVVLVTGARNMGKSALIKALFACDRRVSVWDPMREYGAQGLAVVHSPAALKEFLLAHRRDAARVAFEPGKRLDWFGAWCDLTRAWGHCTAIGEEIATVTNPGKAPQEWGRLIREGKHSRVHLVGVTQRPAEIDKTIVGNITHAYVFALQRRKDRLYMAEELNIEQGMLDALTPHEFIEYQHHPRAVTPGILQF